MRRFCIVTLVAAVRALKLLGARGVDARASAGIEAAATIVSDLHMSGHIPALLACGWRCSRLQGKTTKRLIDQLFQPSLTKHGCAQKHQFPDGGTPSMSPETNRIPQQIIVSIQYLGETIHQSLLLDIRPFAI
jgi:hypothetical protein